MFFSTTSVVGDAADNRTVNRHHEACGSKKSKLSVRRMSMLGNTTYGDCDFKKGPF